MKGVEISALFSFRVRFCCRPGNWLHKAFGRERRFASEELVAASLLMSLATKRTLPCETPDYQTMNHQDQYAKFGFGESTCSCVWLLPSLVEGVLEPLSSFTLPGSGFWALGGSGYLFDPSITVLKTQPHISSEAGAFARVAHILKKAVLITQL